jgi:hypothetical protein
MDDLNPTEGEVAAIAIDSSAQSGHAEVLAWWPANEHSWLKRGGAIKEIIGGHVAKVRHVRVMMREQGAWKWFAFSDADAFPPERMPRHGSSLNAGEAGKEGDHLYLPKYASAVLLNVSSSTDGSFILHLWHRIPRTALVRWS